MTRSAWWGLAACVGLAWGPTDSGSSSADASSLVATRALRERLVLAGRAEARVTQSVADHAGATRVDRGRIALEVPDRLRLDFDSTGERVTVRGDGGEWLQPRLRQMIVLDPEQARESAGIWKVLLEGGGRVFAERALGRGRFLLVPRAAGGPTPDSLWVEIDRQGLPARVDAKSGDQRWSVRLEAWRFTRPVGARGFRIQPPAGFAVVGVP